MIALESDVARRTAPNDVGALARWEDDGGAVDRSLSPQRAQDALTRDLGKISFDLRQEGAYQRGGHAARTLARTADLRLVLVVVKARARIARHHANGTVSLQTLSGHLHVHLPTRMVELTSGQLLVLEAGLEHDVEAVVDSSFLLTLGWGTHL